MTNYGPSTFLRPIYSGIWLVKIIIIISSSRSTCSNYYWQKIPSVAEGEIPQTFLTKLFTLSVHTSINFSYNFSILVSFFLLWSNSPSATSYAPYPLSALALSGQLMVFELSWVWVAATKMKTIRKSRIFREKHTLRAVPRQLTLIIQATQNPSGLLNHVCLV